MKMEAEAHAIDARSSTPKYRQIINNIITDISEGKLKYGQKIPSINETSFDYYLSRDTVEKAYNELRRRGVIISVRGKGFYVNSTQMSQQKPRVLLLFNKISPYKKQIHSAFLDTLKDKAVVDLQIHNYDLRIVDDMLDQAVKKYRYIAVIPHFVDSPENIRKVLSKIPPGKLILLDKTVEGLANGYASVHQSYERDIYTAMGQAFPLLAKYQKMVLVFPDTQTTHYPEEISWGFRNFCLHKGLSFEIRQEVGLVQKGECYFMLKEDDLCEIVKQTRDRKLALAKDVGVVSYNDTPLKEVLCDGISVLTTDHEKMGATAAQIVLERCPLRVENPFVFIQRKSL